MLENLQQTQINHKIQRVIDGKVHKENNFIVSENG